MKRLRFGLRFVLLIVALFSVWLAWIGARMQFQQREVARKKMEIWPSLSSVGFVRDRAAQEQDIAEGNAAFLLQRNGVPIGQPIQIEIPQYALHVNQETGELKPCVLIQAETDPSRPQQLAGVRYLDGTLGVGYLLEFKLFGASPPPPDQE